MGWMDDSNQGSGSAFVVKGAVCGARPCRAAARALVATVLVSPAEVVRFLREGGRQREQSQGREESQAGTARIIAVAVPKGGTGKTTTTLNLGAALAEQGQRVLLVDFDPQGNLTQSLGLRPGDLEHNIYTAIKIIWRATSELSCHPLDRRRPGPGADHRQAQPAK